MLGGMARRVASGKPQRPHVERLRVADRPVLVAELRADPDDMPRPGQRGELATARDVVVVEVCLDHVRDPDVELAGRREVRVDVATRIDDRGDAGGLVGHQSRQVTQSLDPELTYLHQFESTSI